MKTFKEWLEELTKEMIKKFEEHDDKHADNSVIREGFDFTKQLGTKEWLRQQVSYHHAKWTYNSVEHSRMKESDALINSINQEMLLWIKCKLGEEREDRKLYCYGCTLHKTQKELNFDRADRITILRYHGSEKCNNCGVETAEYEVMYG